MARHRVGIPDLLEVRPLAWSLLKGQLADRFSVAVYPLERIPGLLQAGDLELGFVSAVDLLRNADLRRVRDLGVALLPGARTLALRAQRPLAEVRTVDCAAAAPWAVELTRAALAPVMPSASWRDRLGGLGGEEADAELLCGPAAHRSSDAKGVAWLWHQRTGTPLPLGGWAASPRVDVESCEFPLKSSLRYGLSSLEAIASETAAESGLGRAELESHYRTDLSFVLDEAHQKGLDRLRRALRLSWRVRRGAVASAPAAAAGATLLAAPRRGEP